MEQGQVPGSMHWRLYGCPPHTSRTLRPCSHRTTVRPSFHFVRRFPLPHPGCFDRRKRTPRKSKKDRKKKLSNRGSPACHHHPSSSGRPRPNPDILDPLLAYDVIPLGFGAQEAFSAQWGLGSGFLKDSGQRIVPDSRHRF
jgi:hypothetical protein